MHGKSHIRGHRQPTGSPHGQNLTHFLKHEATGRITTPLDGMLVHHRITHGTILLGLPSGRKYPFIRLDGERQCGFKFLV